MLNGVGLISAQNREHKMTQLNQQKIEILMEKVAPNWQDGAIPTDKTAAAFQEYITYAVMKRFAEAYMLHPDSSESVEVSLNFKMTCDQDNIINLKCTPHGWPRDVEVLYDNN